MMTISILVFFSISILIYARTGFKLWSILGYIVYGITLAILRALKAIIKPRQKLSVMKKPVYAVWDYESAFELAATEVIVGFKAKRRPFRINLLESHTLLGATTGGGKTFLLHNILIQLFNKGNKFTSGVDVYICDLKGHPNDMLERWSPVLSGYAKRSADGDISSVLALLRFIDGQLQKQLPKKIMLFVDEVAVVTQDAEGDALLGRIASQLRLNGALIVTIQHPHHTAMKTLIKHNIERRICGIVMNESQGSVILETRVKDDDLPSSRGEFVIREPGHRHLIKVNSRMVDLPGDIDKVVTTVLELSTDHDDRIKLFTDVAGNKETGDSLPGVAKVSGTWNVAGAQHWVMTCYRNFALAGAFEPPEKRGQPYKMAVSYLVGLTLIKQYLADGSWQEDPETTI